MGKMARILKLTKFRRLYKYIILLTVLTLTYLLWPVQQIEKLSDNLTLQEKNDYVESILNPSSDEKPIYHRNNGPVKAEFNPDTKNLDVPTVIDMKNLNEALNKINMRPLGEEENVITEKISVLSEKIINKDFTPIASLNGHLGNLETSQNYYTDLSCKQIAYNPSSNDRIIEYTTPVPLNDDMIEIRQWLLGSHYVDILKVVDPTSGGDTLVSDISHWYKNSGSSVWLPDEQLHMVASTVMYAPRSKNEVLASFIRLQLFDADWKEVKGRRIRYSDVKETEVDKVLTEYTKTNEDRHLDRISFRFPSIISIPIDAKSNKGTIGPENPRVLFKDGEYSSEPVIIFNMISGGKRNMFSVFPLRAPQGPKLLHPIVKFKNIGNDALTTLKSDKNWTPFFDGLKIGDSKTSKGSMYFAYTLDPLVIFKCSLDSGKCTKIQDNIKFSSFAKQGDAYLRGGTPFTPVPRQIIQTLNDGDFQKRLQMWVGFPKVLIKNNKCGKNIYRSTFALLIKEDGVFRIELITSPIDFGLPNASKCPSSVDESSIISAQGISFWDLAASGNSDDKGSVPLYNDYMGLIVGESYSKIEMVVIKNVLNYAMGVYSKGKYMFGEYELEGGVAPRTQKVCECGLAEALRYATNLGTEGNTEFLDKSIEN